MSNFTCSREAICGPVMPFLADGMSADAEEGIVVVEVVSSAKEGSVEVVSSTCMGSCTVEQGSTDTDATWVTARGVAACTGAAAREGVWSARATASECRRSE